MRRTTKEQIDDESKTLGISQDDPRFEALKWRVKNLTYIVKVYIGVTLFCMTFALVSFLWANYLKNHKELSADYNTCNVITGNPNIDAYFWLLNYSTN